MRRTRPQLLRDYALYIGISVAFFLAVSVPVVYFPSFPIHRVAGAVLSGMVSFTLFIRTSRTLWKRHTFWLVVMVLLALHAAFFWLAPVPEHATVAMTVLFLAMELGLFNTVRVLCFRYHPPTGEEII